MREIKFRAWCPKVSSMIPWETVVKECDRLSIFSLPDLVMMQYTGLKDKIGKEIYEDDILQCGSSANLVYFYGGGFTVKNIDSVTAGPASNDWLRVFSNDSMVIGNIHENPDLLEPK